MPTSLVKCPHCGREYSLRAMKSGLMPTHGSPSVCPGSGQIPCGLADRRPLWKDEMAPREGVVGLLRPRTAERLEVRLPLPPSVNNLFMNNRHRGYGRCRTEGYLKWQEEAKFAVLAMGRIELMKLPIRVIVTIQGGKGFSPNRDIDNCLKPIMDLLKNTGLIPDDNVTVVPEVRAVYLTRFRTHEATCDVTLEWIETERPVTISKA